MPKPRRRKDSSFESTMTKSVFLYGDPNREKLAALKRIQSDFTALVNRDIQMLDHSTSVFLQIVKNDRKDPDMRKLERSMRPASVNSAFCQNAFDAAVTHLSNRLDSIRLDMLQEGIGLFAQSRVLFAMSVMGRSCTEMIMLMKEIGQKFHLECADALERMVEKDFSAAQMEFADSYASRCLEYRVPVLRNVSVPLDSRLMRLERSTSIRMPYVIWITDPTNPGKRIGIPVGTSNHSLHKIACNDMAGTVVMQVRKGKLRIGWAYSVKREQPKTARCIGVDTGITDAFHVSDGRVIGSMSHVLDFYYNEVEPAFAGLSDLCNKKRSISHYLRHHDLPENVRHSLIEKMDTLERMIRTADAPYRKKRHYYNDLDHEIRSAVSAYVRELNPDDLTVLEKLDIKEFHKSCRVNGMFSTFARGKLQKTLMETLNWKGCDFLEVAPDYTSQVCPVCANLDPENQKQKEFRCTCCGYEDDADHVGSVNIRDRAMDKEILGVCEKYRYSRSGLQKALKVVYAGRNNAYRKTASTGKAAV